MKDSTRLYSCVLAARPGRFTVFISVMEQGRLILPAAIPEWRELVAAGLTPCPVQEFMEIHSSVFSRKH